MDAKRPDASARDWFQRLQAPHQRRFVLRLRRELKDTGDKSYELATTQSHWSMEGRPVVREANLEQFRKHPKFAKHEAGRTAGHRAALSQSAGYDQKNGHASMGHVH
jgi:hypothetical protein